MLSTKAGDAELQTHAEIYCIILTILKILKYSHYLILHTGQRRARNKPDILDIFVSKIPSNLYLAVHNILDLNSDHSSLILNVDETPQTNSVSHSLFSPSNNHQGWALTG